MPISFTPDNIPRYESGLLSYINENFQRLKNILAKAGVESFSQPANPYLGQRYTDMTLGIDYIWDGTVWIPTSHWGPGIDFTPTWTQSATISKTLNYSRYFLEGKKARGSVYMTASSGGTAANAQLVTLPFTAVYNTVVGSGYFQDGSNLTGLVPYLNSTTQLAFVTVDASYTTVLGQTSSGNPAGVTSGDVLSFDFELELA